MVTKDRLVGDGRLLTRENEFICRVSYDLQLRQEMLIADTLSGRSEIEGLSSGRGTIKLIGDPKDVRNVVAAILDLESGDQVDVLFRQLISPLTRVHPFITSGDIRSAAV